jgi:DNA-binding CsgD family transcriptional regulator
MPDDQDTRLHALWDKLADFAPSEMEAARQYLLAELCALAGADNAMWSGAVRLAQPASDDPLSGWRMPVITYLHAVPGIAETIRGYQLSLEKGPDEKSVRYHKDAGQFRVTLVADMVQPSWFESDFYIRFFRDGLNATDIIFVGAPVNADVEAGLALFRAKTRFTHDDCALVSRALRGLRWFQRQLLLGHGLLLADAPLTPLERQVLQRLLEGKSAKEIAAALDHSTNTTNEYLNRLYRKFGVTSRGELMALWLGQKRPE